MEISAVIALLTKAGPVGVILGIVLLGLMIGVWLRQKGALALGDKTKIVERDELQSINQKLGTIDGRLSDVEHDLSNRPTRRELHEIEISMTRLEGEVTSVGRVTKSTNDAVVRMEDFLLNQGAKKS
ncbi:MAG: DUF2730 family protein [Pseudomonadota bacterium]